MEKATTNQPKKRAKLPKLSKKQRGFVKDYAMTENGTEAVMNHYDVKNSIVAKSIASENLTKPYIVDAVNIQKETLKSALENEGITPTFYAKKVKVLLNATDKEGQNDFTAIDKGLKHYETVSGIEDLEKPKQANTYNFFFNPEVQEQVREMENRIKLMLIKSNV